MCMCMHMCLRFLKYPPYCVNLYGVNSCVVHHHSASCVSVDDVCDYLPLLMLCLGIGVGVGVGPVVHAHGPEGVLVDFVCVCTLCGCLW